MSERIHAVLTGDIVRSTRLSQGELELTRTTLIKAAEALNDWRAGLLVGGPEFFRGDSWQLLLDDSSMALRVAIYLRASLLSTGLSDTRISIGIGSVEKIEPKISLSTGEAFVLSGRGLDEMPRGSHLGVRLPESDGRIEWLRVIVALCDALMSSWTARQAEIVRIAMDPAEPGQKEIVEMLGDSISRQAVGKTLDLAGWSEIQGALQLLEKS